MTIQLTAPILEAGVDQPIGTQLTLSADREAELVNRGVATWAGGDPSVETMTTITVGDGGRFKTIQAAIDSLNTGQCFVPIANTGWLPTTAAVWDNGSSLLEAAAFVFSGAEPLFRKDRLWVKAAGDSFMYRVSALSSYGLDQFYMAVPRQEASLVGGEALEYFVEHPVSIVLLDDYIAERIDFPEAVSVRFVSIGGTRWVEANPDALVQACINHDTPALSALSVYVGWGVNIEGSINITGVKTGLFEFERGSVYSHVLSDGFALNDFGSLKICGDMRCSATAGPGHIMTGNLFGDMVFDDVAWGIYALDAVSSVNYMAFDNIPCRNLIVNGIRALIDDPGQRLDSVQLFSLGTAATQNVRVSGVEINATAPITVPVYLLNEGTQDCSGVTATVAMQNCSINTALCTNAATSLFNTTSHASGSARTVTAINCGGGLIDKPTLGSLTVTHQGLGGGATGAGSAALGANCPAVTLSAPNTWKKVTLDDGTTGYVPVWK